MVWQEFLVILFIVLVPKGCVRSQYGPQHRWRQLHTSKDLYHRPFYKSPLPVDLLPWRLITTLEVPVSYSSTFCLRSGHMGTRVNWDEVFMQGPAVVTWFTVYYYEGVSKDEAKCCTFIQKHSLAKEFMNAKVQCAFCQYWFSRI